MKSLNFDPISLIMVIMGILAIIIRFSIFRLNEFENRQIILDVPKEAAVDAQIYSINNFVELQNL